MTEKDQIKALAHLDGQPTTIKNYRSSYDAIIPLIEKCVVNGRIANPNRFILDLNVLMSPAKLCEALLRETGRWTWRE